MFASKLGKAIVMFATILSTQIVLSSPILMTSFRPVDLGRYSGLGIYFLKDRAYVVGFTADMNPMINEIDLGSLRVVRKIPGVFRSLGSNLLLLRDRKGDSYYLDPFTNVITKPKYMSELSMHISNLELYENEIYYGVERIAEYVDYFVKIDLLHQKKHRFDTFVEPQAISPDRMTLLISSSNGLALWNTEKDDISAIIGSATDPSSLETASFISNDIVITASEKAYGNGEFELWGIDGHLLEDIQFTLENDAKILGIRFDHNLSRAFVLVSSMKTDGSRLEQKGFVDSSEFKRYMEQKYLFRITSSVVSSSGVPLREFPNLSAKILKTLVRNEQAFVIGRSGLISQAGTEKDYWYQVRLHDGSTGWVFGVYINLSKDK